MALSFYVALQSRGILDVAFDPTQTADAALTITSTTAAGHMVGWLEGRQGRVYAVSRSQFSAADATSGAVMAFAEARAETEAPLRLVSRQSTHGHGGVHCGLSADGRLLAVASIRGSTGAVYAVAADGTIGEALLVHRFAAAEGAAQSAGGAAAAADAEATASPHAAVFTASGRYLLWACRDADVISVFSVQEAADRGRAPTVAHLHDVTVPANTGPRHLVLRAVAGRPRSYTMYTVNEHDNTVRVYGVEEPAAAAGARPQPLVVTERQVVSTLGPDHARTPHDHRDLAGEIALSADGRFLYASNRNTKRMDSDTLTVYAVGGTADEPVLAWVGQTPTLGKIPRMFALSPDPASRWIAVANQVTQDVVVLARDADTGLPGRLAGRLRLGSLDKTLSEGPMCILWKE